MTIADAKYVALTALPSAGGAPTRMRVVPLSDGRVGLWAVGDLRRGEQVVRVQACDHHGHPLKDAPPLSGSAEVVRSGRYFDETAAKVRRKYGTAGGRFLLTERSATAVMLVRLDPSGA